MPQELYAGPGLTATETGGIFHAFAIRADPLDRYLARVVEAWPKLPEAIRRAMLAMVKSAGNRRGRSLPFVKVTGNQPSGPNSTAPELGCSHFSSLQRRVAGISPFMSTLTQRRRFMDLQNTREAHKSPALGRGQFDRVAPKDRKERMANEKEQDI
jgi:hypothetical protein